MLLSRKPQGLIQSIPRRFYPDVWDLFDRAEQEGYEVLITTDQSMRYQLNLVGRRLAIIVLLRTAWPYVRLRIEDIRAAVAEVQPGELQEVPI